MKLVKITLSMATIWLAACGSYKASSTASSAISPNFTAADIENGKKEFANLTMADLTEGKKLYETKCTMCHGAKNISQYSISSWKQIVPNMVQKVNNKAPNSMDATMQEQVLKYVVTTVLKNQN